jgi:hypothetical protein
VLFLARALEARSYKERAKGAHGGVLGRSALGVLELLINLAGSLRWIEFSGKTGVARQLSSPALPGHPARLPKAGFVFLDL